MDPGSLGLYAVILRGNKKSSKANINAVALEKEKGKEVEHVWSLPLIIELVRHISNEGVALIGVAEQFSVNEMGGIYKKVS